METQIKNVIKYEQLVHLGEGYVVFIVLCLQHLHRLVFFTIKGQGKQREMLVSLNQIQAWLILTPESLPAQGDLCPCCSPNEADQQPQRIPNAGVRPERGCRLISQPPQTPVQLILLPQFTFQKPWTKNVNLSNPNTRKTFGAHGI